MPEIEIRPWPELTAMLPSLSRAERNRLEASIAEHGVQNPILILPDGRIIDGLHRWQIVGPTCPYLVSAVTDEQAFSLGIALNLARRQLSPEQLADVQEALRRRPDERRRVALELRRESKTQDEAATAVGVARSTVAAWEHDAPEPTPDLRVSVPVAERPHIYERVQAGESPETVAADYHITPRRVSQIATMVEAAMVEIPPVQTPGFPSRRYRTIVLDPPWPLKRVPTERFPLQTPQLDYPTMTLEEIGQLPIPDLADPRGAHIYLWTPVSFLAEALALFERWGVQYQCPLVWVKKHGFVPFSWKYDIELVMFGRIGTLALDRLGLRLSFTGDRGDHSTKPESFYQDRVVPASPPPRLDMFARQTRPGFDSWGAEAPAVDTSTLPGVPPGSDCQGTACPWHSMRGPEGSLLCERPGGPSDHCNEP